MTPLKPPFPYYGGKSSLASRICGQFPTHEHYVEVFAGSLSVLLAKPRSRMETVNDLDGDLMTFWRVLRDQPGDLIKACGHTPHSRAEYSGSQQLDGVSDVERARRVWVNLSQGRTGTLTPTGWRFKKALNGWRASYPEELSDLVDLMGPAAERLTHVTLECLPALELIATYGGQESVLLYVDPPYLDATRAGTNYRCEMGAEIEHRELADALHGCRAAVVLSGYDSALYEELYAGWKVTRMSAVTSQGKSRERTEVLWSNRLAEPDLFGGIAS